MEAHRYRLSTDEKLNGWPSVFWFSQQAHEHRSHKQQTYAYICRMPYAHTDSTATDTPSNGGNTFQYQIMQQPAKTHNKKL